LATVTGVITDDNAWIIDSGASRHMKCERKKIHTLSNDPSSHAMELGDNKICVVIGLGST